MYYPDGRMGKTVSHAIIALRLRRALGLLLSAVRAGRRYRWTAFIPLVLLRSVRENVCNNSKKRKKSCFFEI